MNDLIDRQSAIDAVCNDNCGGHDGCKWYPSSCDSIKALFDIPSAEPERKKGKWIKTDEKEEWYGDIYKCSVCGYRLIDANEKYCPNCGARMDKE